MLPYAPVISFLVLFLSLLHQSHATANSNGDSKIFQNFEYKYFSDLVTWRDAQARCEVWGGNLVSIQSAEENTFVKSFSQERFWLGYSNLAGSWQWVDSCSKLFENWNEDTHEPNNQGGNENCCEMNRQTWGTWNDVSCTIKQGYVCKRMTETCQEWDSSTEIGAPRPVVSTELLDNRIKIRVQMAKRENNKVEHAVSFGSMPPAVNPTQCALIGNAPLCDTDLWNVEEDRCETIYTLDISLQDYIAAVQPEMTCPAGSDLVTMTSELQMMYLDSTPIEGNMAHCNVVQFSTEIKTTIVLLPNSHVDFEYEGDTQIIQPVEYTAVSINDDGKLVVDLVIQPSRDSYYFDNFIFHRHSAGIEFTIQFHEYGCTSSDSHYGCSYRVQLISKEALTDYSGVVVCLFDFFYGGRSTKTSFNLDLQYSLVDQPAIVNDVVSTKSRLTDENYSNDVISALTPFSRAYILTETTEPLYNRASLAIKQAFLCCSKNRQPLAPFDPINGNYGCTQQDMSQMSFWKQLIENGQETDNALDTQIENLGPLTNDKTAFSFDLSTLFGEDKLCYVHVTSRLMVSAAKRGVQENKEHALESVFPISFKSCSYFADESACADAGVCQWDHEMRTCSNIKGVSIDNRRSSSSSSASGIKATVGVSMVVAIASALLIG